MMLRLRSIPHERWQVATPLLLGAVLLTISVFWPWVRGYTPLDFTAGSPPDPRSYTYSSPWTFLQLVAAGSGTIQATPALVTAALIVLSPPIVVGFLGIQALLRLTMYNRAVALCLALGTLGLLFTPFAAFFALHPPLLDDSGRTYALQLGPAFALLGYVATIAAARCM